MSNVEQIQSQIDAMGLTPHEKTIAGLLAAAMFEFACEQVPNPRIITVAAFGLLATCELNGGMKVGANQ